MTGSFFFVLGSHHGGEWNDCTERGCVQEEAFDYWERLCGGRLGFWVVAYYKGVSSMPPACRTPGFLGEMTGRRDENESESESEEQEVDDVDALGMQLTISTVKPPKPSAASAKGSSLDGNGVVEDDSGEAPKVLQVLAAVLDRLVARNEQFANSPSQQGKKLTIFHGLRAPSISIAKYLERIFKYTSCSPSCFVVGYVFLDRLIHRQPDLLVTSLNVHRLLVTSVMVATKMLDDV